MMQKNGFTLPEFLVIIALVILLMLVFASRLQNQYIPQARDAQRKTDLERIKIAFEEYFNDHGCYPDPEVLTQCGSDALQPYLNEIPCDPVTGEPYQYQVNPEDRCKGYRILTRIQYESDPEILNAPCLMPYNYGVSQGMALIPDSCESSPSPSPSGMAPSPSSEPSSSPALASPSPDPSPSSSFEGPFACDPQGVCNIYWDPEGMGCPSSYATVWACWAACENPDNWCPQ